MGNVIFVHHAPILTLVVFLHILDGVVDIQELYAVQFSLRHVVVILIGERKDIASVQVRREHRIHTVLVYASLILLISSDHLLIQDLDLLLRTGLLDLCTFCRVHQLTALVGVSGQCMQFANQLVDLVYRTLQA